MYFVSVRVDAWKDGMVQEQILQTVRGPTVEVVLVEAMSAVDRAVIGLAGKGDDVVDRITTAWDIRPAVSRPVLCEAYAQALCQLSEFVDILPEKQTPPDINVRIVS